MVNFFNLQIYLFNLINLIISIDCESSFIYVFIHTILWLDMYNESK